MVAIFPPDGLPVADSLESERRALASVISSQPDPVILRPELSVGLADDLVERHTHELLEFAPAKVEKQSKRNSWTRTRAISRLAEDRDIAFTTCSLSASL